MLSANELAQLRSAQATHYRDTCIIQTATASADAYGGVTFSYSDGSAIACGFEPTGGREQYRADGTLTVYDAVVRVPVGTSVRAIDRVKVTKRNGETLSTPEVYEVAAPPAKGASALVVKLRKVE